MRAESRSNAPCGGRGSCGKCIVRVLAGNAPPTEEDRAVLSEGMLREGLRLSCRIRPRTPVTVEVQSRFDLRAAPAVTRLAAGELPKIVDAAVDLGSTSVRGARRGERAEPAGASWPRRDDAADARAARKAGARGADGGRARRCGSSKARREGGSSRRTARSGGGSWPRTAR
ncbi:2Fe-2S iron-sulfur cluster-binding protein [Polyangium sorediatum]|uniref:2Fe-2S iron-sulfur cluster-binding protein n=1 Tax=Polyangium sorediatum TaxID=889274 RepID=UPI003CCC439A